MIKYFDKFESDYLRQKINKNWYFTAGINHIKTKYGEETKKEVTTIQMKYMALEEKQKKANDLKNMKIKKGGKKPIEEAKL